MFTLPKNMHKREEDGMFEKLELPSEQLSFQHSDEFLKYIPYKNNSRIAHCQNQLTSCFGIKVILRTITCTCFKPSEFTFR